MKAKVIFVDSRFTDDSSLIVSQLKKNQAYKFVPILFTDLKEDCPVLLVAIGTSNIEHLNIYSIARDFAKSKGLVPVDMPPQGGGRVRLMTDQVHFFHISIGLGAYNMEMMQKYADQLKEVFCVKKVIFS